MNTLIIIDSEIKAAFKKSLELEKNFKGDWVYFDFSDGKTAKGLFQLSPNEDQNAKHLKNALEIHDDFLDCLLGLFTPSLETEFSLKQNNNFKDFCTSLNDTLLKNDKVYDLSRHSFWIMHSNSGKADITVGDKLKQYLDFI